MGKWTINIEFFQLCRPLIKWSQRSWSKVNTGGCTLYPSMIVAFPTWNTPKEVEIGIASAYLGMKLWNKLVSRPNRKYLLVKVSNLELIKLIESINPIAT